MQSNITLTITTGKFSGKMYTFDQQTTFIIGRNNDCHLSIPNEFYRRVSRYHCLLDINPPEIKIKDLGSLNGTYINHQKIGQRERNQSAKEACTLDAPEYNLKDGDEISLGDLVLKVSIKTPVAITSNPEIKPLNHETSKSKIEKSDAIVNLSKLADQVNEDLRVLSGYELIKLIGKSNFGEVYLAQHCQTGKSVALKLMIPKVTQDQAHVETFLQEIKNFHSLKHPNIVDLIEYGYADKLFFICMEYYKIGNVYNLIKQLGGKIPIPMALGIILQVLDGLIYAHNAEVDHTKLANGIFPKGARFLHQNLTPQNILLSNINRKLVAKIADYGLAKSFYLTGFSGQAFTKIKRDGKPVFIPRQQVLKYKDCKPDVDVWAAAACLYNMLTGYVPRDFGKEPWLDILQNDPVPIRQRDHSIPARLAEIIDLALVEKPKIHFQSAAEFKEALVKYIT
ncbi:protein kinase [Okeanomitos corallinicola TIOX110]|uniref:Protein kinase n=1 Tax=Okeanomitos corallinicola TIOX110 TaxID=3133117 RepID=A0ABZ2UUW3_9CYAN